MTVPKIAGALSKTTPTNKATPRPKRRRQYKVCVIIYNLFNFYLKDHIFIFLKIVLLQCFLFEFFECYFIQSNHYGRNDNKYIGCLKIKKQILALNYLQ